MVTSLGVDVDSTWQALIAGKSGLKPITQCDVSDLSKVAGEVVYGDGTNGTFNPDKTIEPKERRSPLYSVRHCRCRSDRGQQLETDRR